MSTEMRPGSVDLETQLLSIMDVLVKTAVTEIRQLFSENSASLCVQLSQSLRENETLRTRMSIMRSELFSLRLQNRNNRPSSRFSHLRGNVPKPRAKQKGKEYTQFSTPRVFKSERFDGNPLPPFNKIKVFWRIHIYEIQKPRR